MRNITFILKTHVDANASAQKSAAIHSFLMLCAELLRDLIADIKNPLSNRGMKNIEYLWQKCQKDRNLSFLIRTFPAMQDRRSRNFTLSAHMRSWTYRKTEHHRYGITPIPKNKFDIRIICSNAAAVNRRGIIVCRLSTE